MSGITVKVEGLKELSKAMDKASVEMQDAYRAANYAEGLELAAESVPLAPIDEGRLRQSGYAAPPTKTRPFCEVGYGVVYARRQHEEHKTRSQYLKRPFNKRMIGLTGRLISRTRKFFKAGIGVSGVGATAPVKPGA